MTEQTTYIGNATVEQAREVQIHYIPKVFTGSPQAMIYLHAFTRVPPRKKTLAERLNDAYKYELEPEETELLDRAAGQLGRRLDSKE